MKDKIFIVKTECSVTITTFISAKDEAAAKAHMRAMLEESDADDLITMDFEVCPYKEINIHATQRQGLREVK